MSDDALVDRQTDYSTQGIFFIALDITECPSAQSLSASGLACLFFAKLSYEAHV